MTSKYASFFEITNTEATCLVDNCGKVLRRKGARSSTSGMRRHLERKHEIVVDEAPVSNTQKAVVTCFIHHDIPLSVLACKCYRNMKETDEPPGISKNLYFHFVPKSEEAKHCQAGGNMRNMSYFGPLVFGCGSFLYWCDPAIYNPQF